jgi:O-antigen ligase
MIYNNRKICISKCAKTKARELVDDVIIISISIGGALLVGLIVVTTLILLGLLSQGIYVSITGSLVGWIIDPLSAGVVVFLLTLFIVIALVLVLTFGHFLYDYVYTPIVNTTKALVRKENVECSLFEYCDEE